MQRFNRTFMELKLIIELEKECQNDTFQSYLYGIEIDYQADRYEKGYEFQSYLYGIEISSIFV